MHTTRGDLVIERAHTAKSSPLRAWSAADVLAIDEITAAAPLGQPGRVLIVNDEFGALSCAFASVDPTIWSDSASSRAAIDHNLVVNGLEPITADRLVRGHEQPNAEFDTIVVRLPKTSALLRYQLTAIAAIAGPNTKVIGAAMARHIHTSTVKAFEDLIGATTTSRATRKARLIHSTPEGASGDAPAPRQSSFVTADGLNVVEMPGTFSSGHVDVGSALLLQVLTEQAVPPGAGSVVADLGCGNGILSAGIARSWTHANFELLDVSDLAVAAATRTWQANDLGDRMTAHAVDGFAATRTATVDVVITNPPFHQGHAADGELTDRLLADAARVLRPNGVAYVVAQRHLHLHTRLRQWFSQADVVSAHPSHVVVVARR